MRLFYTKDFTKFVLSSQGAISTIPLLHLRAVTNFGVAFFLFNKLIKNDVKAAARTDVLHDQVSPFKLCFIIKTTMNLSNYTAHADRHGFACASLERRYRWLETRA
ncbi:hypothetical protein ACS0TY_035962 [Phlomoides rotata]